MQSINLNQSQVTMLGLPQMHKNKGALDQSMVAGIYATNHRVKPFTPELMINQTNIISPDRHNSSDQQRFEKEDKWKMRNKIQLGKVKVQLNEKYTQVNVMKT